MDLRSLSRRLARLGATVTPPRRLHAGLVVQFVGCVDGIAVPVPNVPHRQPESRDPRTGVDIVFVGEDGAEFTPRCA
jgi:hypothetical protein